jgi:hypothetical protein
VNDFEKDVTDQGSLDGLQSWLDLINVHAEYQISISKAMTLFSPNVKKFLIANKCDLKSQRIIDDSAAKVGAEVVPILTLPKEIRRQFRDSHCCDFCQGCCQCQCGICRDSECPRTCELRCTAFIFQPPLT